MTDTNDFPQHVAVIGGGRWARVIADTICAVSPGSTALSLCSPGNPESWNLWLDTAMEVGSRTVELLDLEMLLSKADISHCFIARKAHQHAETALTAISAGKRIFVEKPFALNAREAEAVATAAQGLDCRTGFVFLYHSGFRHFAASYKAMTNPQEIEIIWCDKRAEQRHGEAKRYDASVNIVLDVFPHVWSLLKYLELDARFENPRLEIEHGGSRVHITLNLAGKDVSILIERDGMERQRTVRARSSEHDLLLDFSSDPGVLSGNGEAFENPLAPLRPMAAQLLDFMAPRNGGFASRLAGLQEAKQSIFFSEQLANQARRQQWAFVEVEMQRAGSARDRASLVYAVREYQTAISLHGGGYIVGDRHQGEHAAIMQEAGEWLARNDAS